MPESLKQIKSRIRSIQSTRKVTSAMQMVSAAKLNRTTKALTGLKAYAEGMESVLTHLVLSQEETKNAYFKRSDAGEKSVLLCVITSDMGLCGLNNQNVLRQADEFIRKHEGKDVSLILVGKKGISHFKNRGFSVRHAYAGLNGVYSPIVADEIAGILAHLFVTGQAGAVYIASAYFKNAFHQDAQVRPFLPVEITKGPRTEYIMEQPFERLLEKVTTRYIKTKMRLTLLEAFCSEHAARNMAMKSATDNAEELLDTLTLMRNKIRQASITQEMMEIISSAEALRS
jgi:F-type H+-transporting ATPase subunit gamma